MQKYAGTCSPEQLHTLQNVFDLIWMELRSTSHSNFNGPSDPDTLRAEIASKGEAVLRGYEASLRQLCNHGELMQVLLKPGRYDSDNTEHER